MEKWEKVTVVWEESDRRGLNQDRSASERRWRGTNGCQSWQTDAVTEKPAEHRLSPPGVRAEPWLTFGAAGTFHSPLSHSPVLLSPRCFPPASVYPPPPALSQLFFSFWTGLMFHCDWRWRKAAVTRWHREMNEPWQRTFFYFRWTNFLFVLHKGMNLHP